ncbi:MAG: DnaD domain protein [Clostridia bacterium]|nr:DnaD domain protein [Clostridia bacterium]
MFELDPEARTFGVTAVENRFLTDYLAAAKGDYVKVYLWGLYACGQKGPDYTLAEMADDIEMDVPEIEAALRYWERRSLVSHLSDNPPQYRFFSPSQRQQTPVRDLEVDVEYVSFAESVYAAFGDRRKLKNSEILLAWEWVKDYSLPPEAVLMLLHHCIAVERINFSFRKKAEPLAIRMHEAGVQSVDDAEGFLQHNMAVHDGTQRVLSRMGKRRLPSDDELALYEKWLDQWKFTAQDILDACAETTGGDPSFKYLDGILARLRREAEDDGTPIRQRLTREEQEKACAREMMQHLSISLDTPALLRLYRQCLEIQPHGVILLAADECVRTREKGRVESLLSLLQAWQSRGMTTEADVKRYLSQVREENLALRELFERSGHEARPTAADRAQYETWKSWGYHRELLLLAAEQSRVAQGNKMAYMSRVLEMWHEEGITDISQVRAKKRNEKKPAGPGGKTVTAQQYTQRDYTEEELMAVSDDLIEEAKQLRG